jgi:hypothetical protein
MKRLRLFLMLILALVCLGSGAWRPAGESAAVASAAPAGLSAPEQRALQSQVAKLTAADGAAEDFFGSSVSISGDTAVVGAYGAYAQ